MNDRDYLDVLEAMPASMQEQMAYEYNEYERYLHETKKMQKQRLSKIRIVKRGVTTFAISYSINRYDIPNIIHGVYLLLGDEYHPLATYKQTVRDELLHMLNLKDFTFFCDYYMNQEQADTTYQLYAQPSSDGGCVFGVSESIQEQFDEFPF